MGGSSDVSGAAGSDLSSPAFTPGGTVASLGTPTPGSSPSSSLSQMVSNHGEVSLEVLLALRRLQEQNEALQQENERLRAAATATTRCALAAPVDGE